LGNRKKYQKLDNPGFVGVQDKRTISQIKEDIALTVQFIKKQKISMKRKAKVAVLK